MEYSMTYFPTSPRSREGLEAEVAALTAFAKWQRRETAELRDELRNLQLDNLALHECLEEAGLVFKKTIAAAHSRRSSAMVLQYLMKIDELVSAIGHFAGLMSSCHFTSVSRACRAGMQPVLRAVAAQLPIAEELLVVGPRNMIEAYNLSSRTWCAHDKLKLSLQQEPSALAVASDRLYVLQDSRQSMNMQTAAASIPGPAATVGCFDLGTGCPHAASELLVDGSLSSSRLSSARHRWDTLPAMSSARHGCTMAVVYGRLYVVGGCSKAIDVYLPEQKLLYAGTCECFDPKVGSWTTLSPMPSPRMHCAAASLGGRLYVVGGQDTDGALASAEYLLPDVGQWFSLPPMPTARQGCSAGALGDCLYVAGGCVSWRNEVAALEIFDPEVQVWSELAQMPTPRSFFASMVVDEYIYVAGGKVGAPPLYCTDVLERFDSKSGQWVTMPAMLVPKGFCSGVALRPMQLLV